MILHNVHTIMYMTVVVIPIIFVIPDSNSRLFESLSISAHYLDSCYLRFNCYFSGFLFVRVKCFLLCVTLCCVVLLLCVYVACNPLQECRPRAGRFRDTLSLRTTHMRSQWHGGVSGVAAPPAPMNSVKIFKGWPLQDAPSMLVQLWYKSFPPGRFLPGGNEEANYVE